MSQLKLMKQKAYDAECCAAREKNDHERVLAEAKAREAMMLKATADKVPAPSPLPLPRPRAYPCDRCT